MTVDDFLKQNREVLKTMARNGISLNLTRCIGMVEFYQTAKAENGSDYAIALCKEKYGIKTRRHVYQILKSLKREI